MGSSTSTLHRTRFFGKASESVITTSHTIVTFYPASCRLSAPESKSSGLDEPPLLQCWQGTLPTYDAYIPVSVVTMRAQAQEPVTSLCSSSFSLTPIGNQQLGRSLPLLSQPDCWFSQRGQPPQQPTAAPNTERGQTTSFQLRCLIFGLPIMVDLSYPSSMSGSSHERLVRVYSTSLAVKCSPRSMH